MGKKDKKARHEQRSSQRGPEYYYNTPQEEESQSLPPSSPLSDEDPDPEHEEEEAEDGHTTSSSNGMPSKFLLYQQSVQSPKGDISYLQKFFLMYVGGRTPLHFQEDFCGQQQRSSMAEEHRCQAPRLCVNNCGFFGIPATQNLCSKCYRDLQLKEQQSSNAKLAFSQTLSASSPSFSSPSSELPAAPSSSFPSPAAADDDVSETAVDRAVAAHEEEDKEAGLQQQPPNRCLTCRKRVGLTGFKCRCGMVFCGTHRYPEQHDCVFDFKSLGKQQIAKSNPVVKGEKLQNKI